MLQLISCPPHALTSEPLGVMFPLKSELLLPPAPPVTKRTIESIMVLAILLIALQRPLPEEVELGATWAGLAPKSKRLPSKDEPPSGAACDWTIVPLNSGS